MLWTRIATEYMNDTVMHNGIMYCMTNMKLESKNNETLDVEKLQLVKLCLQNFNQKGKTIYLPNIYLLVFEIAWIRHFLYV